jgi:hypothetical protein
MITGRLELHFLENELKENSEKLSNKKFGGFLEELTVSC